jgi:hypothetical protein
MVIHACNLSDAAGRGRRITVGDKPQTKEISYLKNKLKQKKVGLWFKW